MTPADGSTGSGPLVKATQSSHMLPLPLSAMTTCISVGMALKEEERKRKVLGAQYMMNK